MSEKQTPLNLLKAQGKIDPHVVAVRVNGKTVDFHTPIDAASDITPILDSEPEGLRNVKFT